MSGRVLLCTHRINADEFPVCCIRVIVLFVVTEIAQFVIARRDNKRAQSQVHANNNKNVANFESTLVLAKCLVAVRSDNRATHNVLLETMNYLDYLCGVYDICFKQSPSRQLGGSNIDGAAKKSKSKFYDHPIGESLMGATTLKIYSTAPQSGIGKQRIQTKFHNSDWDVVPKSCAGDWVMRYTNNETNFHPWQINTKFSHFELVPWRQQKKNIDLLNAIGCEPVQLTDDNRQQLRTLQKFEVARSKRLLKQRLKIEKNRIKRQIKIRLVFSLELRHKKMKLFRARQNQLRRQFPNGVGGGGGERQLFAFDPNCFSLATEHWGYFSQRNKGVEELLVNDVSQLRAITNGSATSKTTSNRQRSRMAAVFQEVPCAKCKDRCVCLVSLW